MPPRKPNPLYEIKQRELVSSHEKKKTPRNKSLIYYSTTPCSKKNTSSVSKQETTRKTIVTVKSKLITLHPENPASFEQESYNASQLLTHRFALRRALLTEAGPHENQPSEQELLPTRL